MELMSAGSGFVFDLFHTLVDPAHFRSPAFRRVEAVTDACGITCRRRDTPAVLDDQHHHLEPRASAPRSGAGAV